MTVFYVAVPQIVGNNKSVPTDVNREVEYEISRRT